MAEIEARGVRFHYQRLGSGTEKVVFVHGFVWDNLSSWYFSVASSVAAKAQVLLYDLRGHGKSERPPTGYTLDDMVADLDALLGATGFGDRPVHLVGNSFGGLLALAYAIAHPERVASMVLVDAHTADETWNEQIRATLLSEGLERDHIIIQAFHDWAGRHNDPRNTRLAKTAEQLVKGTSLLDEITRTRVFTDQELARITCPVLAMYGEHSEIRHKGERLAERLPDCTLQIIGGGSHVILWEATATLRERVQTWVAEHSGPTDQPQASAD
jgi:pimeloyl-ACP methyl ester carboxylesterase